jgi:hypothetical protein
MQLTAMADLDEQIVEVQEVEIEAIPIQIKDEIDSDDENDGKYRYISIIITFNAIIAFRFVITFLI